MMHCLVKMILTHWKILVWISFYFPIKTEKNLPCRRNITTYMINLLKKFFNLPFSLFLCGTGTIFTFQSKDTPNVIILLQCKIIFLGLSYWQKCLDWGWGCGKFIIEKLQTNMLHTHINVLVTVIKRPFNIWSTFTSITLSTFC